MSAEADSGPAEIATGPNTPNPVVSRRKAMQLGAAAGATVMASTGGIGSAFAQSTEIDWAGDITPDLRLRGTVTIEGHDRGEFDSPLGYFDDSNEAADLTDDGIRVRDEPREDDDADDPWNPFQLDVTEMDAVGFRTFPRATYEDADGDEQDIDWHDTDMWTEDNTEVTLSESSNSVDAPILEFSTSGVGSGTTVSATFNDTEFDDVSFDGKNFFQAIIDVVTLSTDATVTIIIEDASGNNVQLEIDDASDTANDDVIADATGVVTHQVRLEDLPNSDTVNEISDIRIECADADAEVHLYALDCGSPVEWDFGEEQYTDSDNDLDTQEINEPSGSTYSITHVDTMGQTFDEAVLGNYQVDIEQRIEDLPDDKIRHRIEDFENSTFFPRSLEGLIEFDPFLGVDVSYSGLELVDTQNLEDSHYNSVEQLDGEEDVTFEDYDDEEYDSWIDRTSNYDSQDEVVTLDGTVSATEETTVYFKQGLTEEQETDIKTSSGGGVGPVEEPDDGLLGMVFSLPGVIIASVVSFFGLRRMGWLGGEG